MTVLPGTTASLRGVTGDAGALIKTEYAGDRQEWQLSLEAAIPSVNTGISEMWYLDRVAKICSNQPGGVDPTVHAASYFWQVRTCCVCLRIVLDKFGCVTDLANLP